jgi:hypothetical protein
LGLTLRSNWAFKSPSDFSHDRFRSTDPTERSRQSITSLHDANKEQPGRPLPPVQKGVWPHNSASRRQSGTVAGPYRKPDTTEAVDTQTRSNVSRRLAANARETVLDSGLRVFLASKSLPTPVPPETVHPRSTSKTFMERALASERPSIRSDVNHARPNAADFRKPATTVSFKASRAQGNIPARSDVRSPAIANATSTAPRPSRADKVLEGANVSEIGEHGSPRQPGHSTSEQQTSNVVGELWLDALSLREWLQAYLAGEMRHALQATNRFGTSFE